MCALSPCGLNPSSSSPLSVFGAVCIVRCLSVYGLTILGLWLEVEGNPTLFDPSIHKPQHC